MRAFCASISTTIRVGIPPNLFREAREHCGEGFAVQEIPNQGLTRVDHVGPGVLANQTKAIYAAGRLLFLQNQFADH